MIAKADQSILRALLLWKIERLKKQQIKKGSVRDKTESRRAKTTQGQINREGSSSS